MLETGYQEERALVSETRRKLLSVFYISKNWHTHEHASNYLKHTMAYELPGPAEQLCRQDHLQSRRCWKLTAKQEDKLGPHLEN